MTDRLTGAAARDTAMFALLGTFRRSKTTEICVRANFHGSLHYLWATGGIIGWTNNKQPEASHSHRHRHLGRDEESLGKSSEQGIFRVTDCHHFGTRNEIRRVTDDDALEGRRRGKEKIEITALLS